jgi:O-antigen/teichoic acid export membrane protein
VTVEPESMVETATSRFGAKRLYRDAGSMAFSQIANAAFGVVFWAVAAKLFEPQRLGVMTAVLAVIVAAGLVVASGVGDAYTALLPAVGAARHHVYRRGQRVLLAVSIVTGVVGGWATISLLPQVRGSVAVAALVAVGIVGWAAFIAQNSTLISLGRARWLPAANIAVSVVKIALLPLFAMMFAWHSVELAFVASATLVVLVLTPAIGRIIASGKDLPDKATIPESRAIGAFNSLVVQTMASSALSLGALTVTPFLVTKFAGPKEGALFALSLSIVQALDMIGAGMGVSLVVHASSSPEQGNAMARSIMLRATALCVVGSVGLVAVMPTLLRLLNKAYGEMSATSVIAVLCLGSIIRVVYMVWSGLQRSRRRMKMPLVFNFISAAMLFAIIPGLCAAHGALGGAIAILIPQMVLSAGAATHFLLSSLREGATPHGRHAKQAARYG